MIQRRKDYSKREPTKDSHKIYVICEGKGTEPDYFAFFEGLSSNLQVITIPPTTGTDPLKLMELSKERLTGEDRLYTVNYQYGDTVWFVIDTDTWEAGEYTTERRYNINPIWDGTPSAARCVNALDEGAARMVEGGNVRTEIHSTLTIETVYGEV